MKVTHVFSEDDLTSALHAHLLKQGKVTAAQTEVEITVRIEQSQKIIVTVSAEEPNPRT